MFNKERQGNNFNNFSEIVNLEVKSEVGKFVFKSFGIASFYFLIFGAVVVVLSWLLSNYVINDSSAGILNGRGAWYLFIPFLLMSFLMQWLRMKWINNVVNASRSLIIANYSLQFLFYLVALVPMLMFLNLIDSNFLLTNPTSFQIFLNTLKYSVVSFGGAFVAYIIPAIIGYKLRSAKVAYNLMRVLIISSIVSFIIYLVYIFASLFTQNGWLSNGNTFLIVINILLGLIAILSPILTIYRMKKTAAFIDFSDPQLAKKWSQFFAFQIIGELLFLAFFILRMISLFRR